MRAQKLISRVGNAREIGRSQNWVIPRPGGDHGPEAVCAELQDLGEPPRSHLRTKSRRGGDICPRLSLCLGERPEDHGALLRAALGCAYVPFDLVRSLMGKNEGQFIFVAGIDQQRQREENGWAAEAIAGLEGVAVESGAIIDEYLQVTGTDDTQLLAFSLGHRGHSGNDRLKPLEGPCGLG